MKRIFEDFLDDVESNDLELQSDDLGDMRPESYQYMFIMPVDYLDICDMKPIDKTLLRYLRIVERVLDNNRCIIDYSVPVYVTRSPYISDFERLLQVKPREEYQQNDIRYHANDYNTTLAFYANCNFRTVQSFLLFVEAMQVIYPTKCRPQLYYMRTDDPRVELYCPISILRRLKEFKQHEMSKNVYASQVANSIIHIAPIVKLPFETIHLKIYDIAGLKPGLLLIAHAVNESGIREHLSLSIPKKTKGMIIGSAVNPDVLVENKGNGHSMKWRVYMSEVKMPSLMYFQENLIKSPNKAIEPIRKMIKDGRAVIRDVAIKCYSANLDWMMMFYLGPVQYSSDGQWYECILLGTCQVSEDEITLTFKKAFSDELMKNKKFAEMADDLMYALFDKANSY